jgi:hypothetical protein
VSTYRAPMRSRLDDVDPALAVERALDLGVCGVGGRLTVEPTTLDEAVRAVALAHDERVAARLRRFALVDDGAEVWTRDAGGRFVVGVLEGPWRWDGDDQAFAADLQHVRRCTWSAPDAPVPHAVLASFERGGRNFQRITALG